MFASWISPLSTLTRRAFLKSSSAGCSPRATLSFCWTLRMTSWREFGCGDSNRRLLSFEQILDARRSSGHRLSFHRRMKNDIFRTLAEAARRNEAVALGIITGVKGSSPQKLGAKAIFHADRRIEGTLGG